MRSKHLSGFVTIIYIIWNGNNTIATKKRIASTEALHVIDNLAEYIISKTIIMILSIEKRLILYCTKSSCGSFLRHL